VLPVVGRASSDVDPLVLVWGVVAPPEEWYAILVSPGSDVAVEQILEVRVLLPADEAAGSKDRILGTPPVVKMLGVGEDVDRVSLHAHFVLATDSATIFKYLAWAGKSEERDAGEGVEVLFVTRGEHGRAIIWTHRVHVHGCARKWSRNLSNEIEHNAAKVAQ